MDDSEAKIKKQLEGQGLASLDIAYIEAKRIIDGQLAQVDGLDTKAGILVGFAGLVLGSIFNAVPNLTQHRDPFVLPVTVLTALILLFAGIASLSAYGIKDYQTAPSISEMFKKLLNWEDRHSKYLIVRELAKAYDQNALLISNKTKWIRISLLFLVIGFLLITIASIYPLLQTLLYP